MSEVQLNQTKQMLEARLSTSNDRKHKKVINEFFNQYPEGKFSIYQTVDLLGFGRQGLVLDVKDDNGKEYIAKVVGGNLVGADYDRLLRAIKRGINISKYLDNPHFPNLLEVIEQEEFFITVKDKAKGKSLSSLIQEKGRLKSKELASIILSAAEGLSYLHGEDVIHRDIKSDHLIVDENGFVRIIDMDTSKEEGEDGTDYTSVGSFSTRHPLQEIGESEKRCDLYSLGLTAVEGLTGKIPRELLLARTPGFKDYELPERIPEPLRKIVNKAVKVRLEENYQSANELIHDLREYLQLGQKLEEELLDESNGNQALVVRKNNSITSKNLEEQLAIVEKAEVTFPYQSVSHMLSGALGVVSVGIAVNVGLGMLTSLGMAVGSSLVATSVLFSMKNYNKRNYQYERDTYELMNETSPLLIELKKRKFDLMYDHVKFLGKDYVIKTQNRIVRSIMLGPKEALERSTEIKALEKKIAFLSPLPYPEWDDWKYSEQYSFNSYCRKVKKVSRDIDNYLEDLDLKLNYHIDLEAKTVMLECQIEVDKRKRMEIIYEIPTYDLIRKGKFKLYFDNKVEEVDINMNNHLVLGDMSSGKSEHVLKFYSDAYELINYTCPDFFGLMFARVN